MRICIHDHLFPIHNPQKLSAFLLSLLTLLEKEKCSQLTDCITSKTEQELSCVVNIDKHNSVVEREPFFSYIASSCNNTYNSCY